ncbi:MAG TPA: hypothetical protein VGN26_16465 [Armatimonadota bacterium]
MPTLTFTEVVEAKGLPNLRWWRDRGALGLMNTRAIPSRYTPQEAERLTADPQRASAYLTLGAGTRCVAGLVSGGAFSPDEQWESGPASEVYLRRNLLSPEACQVLQLNPLHLEEANTGIGYTAHPGALGQLLRAAGLQAVVLGDADRPEEPHREAAMVAMDRLGIVGAAPGVGQELPAPSFATRYRAAAPFGRETSVRALAESVRRAAGPKVGLIVIDWGDAARLDDYRRWMTDTRYLDARARMLTDLDRLLGQLRRVLRPESDLLLLVSPHPGRESRTGFDLLAPVVASPASLLQRAASGPGARGGAPLPPPLQGARPSLAGPPVAAVAGPVGGGALLTSPTTRRRGIVANTDVAPTIASVLGLGEDPTIVGRPMVAQPVKGAVPAAQGLHGRLVAVEVQRRRALRWVLETWRWGMVLLALWALFGGYRWVTRAGRALGLVLLALPVVVLAGGGLPALSVAGYSALLVTGAIGLAALAGVLERWTRVPLAGVLVLASLLVVGTIADGLRGFQAMPYTILSYSVMEGARYYGIGNEFMGCLIAAALLAASVLVARGSRRGGPEVRPTPWRWVAAALFGLTALVLAGPSWGAKFGGAITASLAFSFALLRFWNRPITRRLILGCFFSLVAVVTLVVLADLARGGQSTHVGRLVRSVQELGVGELLMVFQRKWAINLRLLMYSPWSRLMQLALLPCALYYWRGALRTRLPAWTRPPAGEGWPPGAVGIGLTSILLAGLVAFLVNDAGVLAAATGLLYAPVGLVAWEASVCGQELPHHQDTKTPREPNRSFSL